MQTQHHPSNTLRRGPLSRSLGAAAPGLLVLLLLLPGASGVVGMHPGQGTAPRSAGAPSPVSGPGPLSYGAGSAPSYRIIHPPILPQWVNVTSSAPGGTPPSSYGGTMAYDPVDNETVYFGGCTNTQCPSDGTWVFSHGLWTNITNPSDAPPARELASMDFDAHVGSVLLFGGAGAGGVLGDTWLFHGGVWTNVTSLSQGPAPREGAMLAFDPAPEENGSVLFGGCVGSGFNDDCFNATWVWQSWSGWVPLSTSIAPPAVGFGAMAYDPASGDIVQFGGCAGFLCSGLSSATWELYSGQWWATYPSSSPSARADMSMVYDPAIPGLFLFGGIAGTFPTLTYQNDTWSFSNGVWTLWGPTQAPSGRESYALSTDPTGGTPLLFGGSGSTGYQNDTWAFEYVFGALLTASTYTPEVDESVTFTVVVGGGTAPFDGTIAFGDGSVGVVSGSGSALQIVHTYRHPGSYVASVNVSDGVGAMTSATASTITVASGPTVSASATPGQGDVGIALSFRASGSGGTAPLTFAWQFGDGSSATGVTASHAYLSVGTERVKLTATDALGAVATTSLPVVIAPDPSATIDAGPSAPGASSERLSANVSGGTAPFNYTWRFGDGSESGLPSPVHQFSGSGSYTVDLWVNDSAGGSVHRSMVVSASGPSTTGASSSSGSSGTPLWFWVGLAVLLVAGVVGAVVLARRTRPPEPRDA